MLPRKHRLQLQSGKKLEGKVVSGRFLVLVVHPHLPTLSQAAVIISKKVARLAVDRNRLKRQISHALYPLLQTIPPSKLLIIAKKPIVTAGFAEIDCELRQLISRSL